MPYEVNSKIAEKGQEVVFSFNGQDFKGTIVQTTVVNFVREYLVEFADGSKRWFVNIDFSHLLN